MEVKDFYYDLPEDLIAQEPIENRDSSRLLVLKKSTDEISHRRFFEVTDYFSPGDCLVLNDTRVIPARIFGKTKKGADIELLLLRPRGENIWEVLLKPGKRGRPGDQITFGDLLTAEVQNINEPSGSRDVKFSFCGDFSEILEKIGKIPLPPYIKKTLSDKERYQTVYGKNPGSAAAPTAGLHFTPDLLQKIRALGVEVLFLTLHVGLGTFRPVKEKTVEAHVMHSEYCRVSPDVAERVNAAKQAGKKVFAVGTTVCRTLESAAGDDGILRPFDGETDIFIYPGYNFRLVDSLITNFHLPESTLLMLVSALAGREKILRAYSEAIAQKYRFFSFGDAMLID